MTDPVGTPEEFVRGWMRRWKVPGAALAVVGADGRTVARGYGFRDREARLPATPRTVFGLASVTKSFTALALLRLEEEGKLSTRDPIVRHLPEFRTPDVRASPRITIHHFLTHTSGLPPLPSIYYTTARSLAHDPPFDPRVARRVGIDLDHAPIDTYEQMMEFLRTTRYRLIAPPGQAFSYSNEGFGLLGAVIERASGRRYEDYLEEEILRPAGMRSTIFDPGVLFRSPEVTTLYSPKRSGLRRPLVPSQTWWDDACLRACGGLRSNVEDMARYVQIFLNAGRVDGVPVVGAGSVRKMTTPHVETAPERYYGYGVHVRPDYHGTPLVYHDGALPGVSSFVAAAPKRHVGGVVLTNVEGVQADLALMSWINAGLGLPLATSIVPTPPPAAPKVPLRQYEGWYGCGEGVWFEVIPRRDALWLDFHGTAEKLKGLRVRPAGQDRFVYRLGGQHSEVRFERDSRGHLQGAFFLLRFVRRRAPGDFRRARTGTLVW